MKASEYFGDWMGVIDTQELYRVVSWIGKLDKTTLCPASQNIFRAFQACPLKDCKVVFLGQDPYPQQGDEFNFDFSKHPEILIAGDNGCGKSTLVNVIRDYQCDNSKDDPNAVYQTKLGYCDIRGFKNKVEISTDFTRFYFISAEFDDPTSLNNSASAEALLENGGFQTKRMSTGQRGLAMLSKWLEENKEHWDEKTLLVFDEVDKGFDLSRQVGMSNMYRNLHKKFNVSILAVTHTLFPILAREEMFYFEFRKMVSSKFYCWMKTGYNITAEKLEENERKED